MHLFPECHLSILYKLKRRPPFQLLNSSSQSPDHLQPHFNSFLSVVMEPLPVVISEPETVSALIETGKKLQTPPENVAEILALLDSTEGLLCSLGQSPPYPMRRALVPTVGGLISNKLFRHQDMDVKISTLCCIHELTRISAIVAPYKEDTMREIFQETVMAFRQLRSSGRSYNKVLHILEIVARLKSSLMLLDLGCDELVVQMFEELLSTIQSNHPDTTTTFSYMEEIMTCLLMEGDKISIDLLRPLLVSARNGNQISSASQRLATKVLQNCSARVKPYLDEAVEQMKRDIEVYTDIVPSIWPDVPAAENVMEEAGKGYSDIVSKTGDGTTEESTKIDVTQKRKWKRRRKDVGVKKEDSERKYGSALEQDAQVSLTRSSKRPRNVKEYREELIGSRVKVWWPNDQEFYEGVVESYSPFTKKHKVTYVDGDVEILRLKQEHWILLDNISTQECQEGNLPTSSAVPVESEKEITCNEDKHNETQENASSSKESSQLQADKPGGDMAEASILPRNTDQIDASKNHGEC